MIIKNLKQLNFLIRILTEVFMKGIIIEIRNKSNRKPNIAPVIHPPVLLI